MIANLPFAFFVLPPSAPNDPQLCLFDHSSVFCAKKTPFAATWISNKDSKSARENATSLFSPFDFFHGRISRGRKRTHAKFALLGRLSVSVFNGPGREKAVASANSP